MTPFTTWRYILHNSQYEGCALLSTYEINEDPVTGSAHCTLAPYWAQHLGRTTLSARQLSKRTGALRCRVEGEPYLSSLGVFKDAIIAILSALARQEKVRISERTKAGLERTRRVNGTRLGRPRTDGGRIRQAVMLRQQGLSCSRIGERMGITRGRAHQLIHAAV